MWHKKGIFFFSSGKRQYNTNMLNDVFISKYPRTNSLMDVIFPLFNIFSTKYLKKIRDTLNAPLVHLIMRMINISIFFQKKFWNI